MPGISKKDLKKLIRASNNHKGCTAVLFRCPHYPDYNGTLMSLDHALAHWQECEPYARAATYEELAKIPMVVSDDPSKRTEPHTFWNGERCFARKVLVEVGASPQKTWWCAALVGTTREAVEVEYYGEKFYLDNEGDRGWLKVTTGMGSPQWMHKSLPVERVIEK